jgi:hypothetical protein
MAGPNLEMIIAHSDLSGERKYKECDRDGCNGPPSEPGLINRFKGPGCFPFNEKASMPERYQS